MKPSPLRKHVILIYSNTLHRLTTRNYFCSLKAKLISSLLGCLCLLSCSQPPQLSPLDSNETILALGDSLTVGVGTKPEFSYPTMLQSDLSQTIINGGVSGDKTADGLKRLDQLLQQHNPSLVIVCLGGNDFLRKVPKQKIKRNLRTIIDKIKSHQAEVMLVAVPDISLFVSDSDIYQQIAEESKVPLMTDVLSDLLSDDDYKSDPIHLNRQGYALFAEEVRKFLQEQGALVD